MPPVSNHASASCAIPMFLHVRHHRNVTVVDLLLLCHSTATLTQTKFHKVVHHRQSKWLLVLRDPTTAVGSRDITGFLCLLIIQYRSKLGRVVLPNPLLRSKDMYVGHHRVWLHCRDGERIDISPDIAVGHSRCSFQHP